jgi:rhodanese-related sulfurtransferase
MNRVVKFLTALLVSVGVLAGVTACSTPEKVDMSQVTAVIDVRTPEEFAEGHLEGALNLNIEGSSFAADIAKLDPTGTYVVYCRSGNRAGKAVTAMQQIGIPNVPNLGAVADASAATGIAVVK